MKVRRELVFRRLAVRVQFYEVVQAVSEGCRFQQEELDDEEADLNSEEVSSVQATKIIHIFILNELRVHLYSIELWGQRKSLLSSESSDAKHHLST